VVDSTKYYGNDYEHDAPMFIQQQEAEVENLKKLVKTTSHLVAPMAEVGVCEGGSAWIIRETDTKRDFHLFDTFEGIPGGNAFCCADLVMKPLEYVKKTFKDKPRMFFHKGAFPQVTGRYAEDYRFSFVHIDVDLYRSVLDCLGFFYYRMTRGGVIVVHDYLLDATWGSQVKKAVDLFYCDKPEKPQNLHSQVWIVKEKEETLVKLPSKDDFTDLEKINMLIDYLTRKEKEGAW
jgi:hypothetical protein